MNSKYSTFPSGFSLIELLAATAILAMIVLILGGVFHQSSLAWSGGMRKAAGSMTGRAIVSMISRELNSAVSETNLFAGTFKSSSGSDIEFIALAGSPANGRIATKIRYEFSNKTIIRKSAKGSLVAYGDPSSWAWDPASGTELSTNIASLHFYFPGDWVSVNVLPKWVRIELVVESEADVSGVTAMSDGPDGTAGNSDDVTSN